MSEPQKHKEFYPPLVSSGVKRISLAELEETFLGVTNSSRRRLVTRTLKMFIEHLQLKLQVRGELWVDGSFTTHNPSPHDVDVALGMTVAQHDDLESSNREKLRHYGSISGREEVRARWNVDFYLLKLESLDERNYWEGRFTKYPDSDHKKGYVVVEL